MKYWFPDAGKMSAGRSWTCLLLVGLALGLASGVTDQAKFVKEPGQKIVSNADQLVSFSKPGGHYLFKCCIIISGGKFPTDSTLHIPVWLSCTKSYT